MRKVIQEHADILKAVLDRDIDAAVLLLQEHYEQTAEFMRTDLETVEAGDVATPA